MIANNKGFLRYAALLALLCLAFFLGCEEEPSPVESSSLAWIRNPTVDASLRGQFSIAQGEVEGDPPPSKTYYIYTPKGSAYPQVENPLQADWIQAGWVLVDDPSAPVKVSEGEYILHGIAENDLAVVQSPGIPVNVVKAIPPTTWTQPVTVNAEVQEGKITINPGIADGDPAPSYEYYYASQDAEAPPEGNNNAADWYYAGWELIDTKDSLSVGMQAGSYSMYAVAVNASETRLRSEKIEFQVTGFAPTWSQEPKFSTDPYVFGRFNVENGIVNGNPPPEVTYYFAPRGTSVPDDDSAISWSAWKRFFDSDVTRLNGIIDHDTGFYDFYAVARNAYDPPVRKGPYEVNLAYMETEVRLIQEHIPNEWRDFGLDAGFFSDGLDLADGTIILTGGDFENTYYSVDGGAHWKKNPSPSGLKGQRRGTLVELDNRILYLSGNGNSKVYKSVDGGMTFAEIGDAPWSPRRLPSAVVFNDRIWVIGGHLVTMTLGPPSDTLFAEGASDIYYTEDYGNTWTLAVAEVPWRDDAQSNYRALASQPAGVAGVFNDHLWFFAPRHVNGFGGLWKSWDGITWNQTGINATMDNNVLSLNSIFSYKNRLWIMAMEWSHQAKEVGGRLQYTSIGEENMQDYNTFPNISLYKYIATRYSSGVYSHGRARTAITIPWQDPKDASNSGIRIIYLGNQAYLNSAPNEIHMHNIGERTYGLKWHE